MAFTNLTTGKQLPQFTSGTARGSWATELNEELIQPVNNILGLQTVISIPNANDITLTAAQRETHSLRFNDGSSGSLTSSSEVDIIFASTNGSFIIDNNTPALLRILPTAGSSNASVIQPNSINEIYWDGSQWKILSNPFDGTIIDGNAKIYDSNGDAALRIYDDGTVAGRSDGNMKIQYKTDLTFVEETATNANFDATTTENRMRIGANGNIFIGKDGPALGVPGIEFHPNTIGEGNAQGTHMAVVGTRSADIVRIFGETQSTATPRRESFFNHNSGSIEVRKGLPVDKTEAVGTGGQRAIDFYLDGVFCGAIVMEVQIDRATNNPVGSLQILDGRGRRIYMRQDTTQG